MDRESSKTNTKITVYRSVIKYSLPYRQSCWRFWCIEQDPVLYSVLYSHFEIVLAGEGISTVTVLFLSPKFGDERALSHQFGLRISQVNFKY